jgi:hypothetical protein
MGRNPARPTTVIPAKAGIQASLQASLDPGFRRDDELPASQFRKAL